MNFGACTFRTPPFLSELLPLNSSLHSPFPLYPTPKVTFPSENHLFLNCPLLVCLRRSPFLDIRLRSLHVSEIYLANYLRLMKIVFLQRSCVSSGCLLRRLVGLKGTPGQGVANQLFPIFFRTSFLTDFLWISALFLAPFFMKFPCFSHHFFEHVFCMFVQ